MAGTACVYCTSRDTTAQEKFSARRYLHIHTFFSPINSREKVRSAISIRCNKCEQTYEKLEIKKLDWVTKIFFTETAISNLKSIFPKLNVTKLLKCANFVKYIKAVTKITNDNFHLIIQVKKKRAFIDCYRYGAPVAAVSVEEIYL